MYHLKKRIISAFFIFCLALPLIMFSWNSGDYSEDENRNLASFPRLFINGHLQINDLTGQQIKIWFEDHIGLRKQFSRVGAEFKLKVLHQSPSPQVHIGKDNWYFYTKDNNLDIALGKYPIDNATLQRILTNHLLIREKLAKKGIDYVIIFPPSKVSIYPEKIRLIGACIRQTPVDIVANYLEKHSDLKIIRLKDELLNEKKNTQVFFKTDTHWTQDGAYIAYRKIINDMRKWGLCITEPISVHWEQSEYLGEMGGMMGSRKLLGPEPTRNSIIPSPKAKKNKPSLEYDAFRAALMQEKIYPTCIHYNNPSISRNRVVMFGDSMFASWNITELLAEHFSSFSYIWDYSIRENLLDLLNPNIVIYEMTERYLNIFPDKNIAYIQNKLIDYQAQIVSYKIDKNNLEVCVLNTSKAVWTEQNYIRLGLWSKNKDSSLRSYIHPKIKVQPGETYSFVFTNIHELNLKDIAVQMLQEGVCYFGERKPIETL